MAERHEHGKDRFASDRLKDLRKDAPTASDPSAGRATGGRFATGNRAAAGRGWRGIIRDSLGPATEDGLVVELAEVAMATYKADSRSLPSQSPGVLQECAAAARHATLASYYAQEAAKAGLASETGLALAEASRKHDTAARQHRTAAFTRSSREASVSQARPVSAADIGHLLRRGMKQEGT